MDLRQALRARRIPLHEGRNGEINICCPFCVEKGQQRLDDRFRLGINTRTGKAHCFNCGWSSHKNGVRLIARRLEMGEITSGPSEKKEKKAEPVRLPEDFALLWDVRKDAWYRDAWTYLVRRQVTEQQIQEKRVGVSMTGRYAYRIVFPMYNGSNKLIGIVSRDFTGKQEPPYLNSRGDKGLYNLPAPKNRRHALVLTEGVFDALAVERATARLSNRPDTAAILGRALTPIQEAQLKESGYEAIILWLDGDGPGINGAIAIAKQLRYRYPMQYVAGGNGKDAGGMSNTEILNLYAQRKPFVEGSLWRERAQVVFQED